MGNCQILDAVHANDTIKSAHSSVILLLLAIEDFGWDFVFVD